MDILHLLTYIKIYCHIYDPGLAGTPQCNVPILTALVLALPHNDRCGVIRGSQFRGTWMGQTK